ncbi:MAG: alpha-ketoglutarate-dependent dioxygenase AlkB [Bacteroidetes bacterium]|nr:alpha-ketoglutarate-dependent dioxygenase AlkB [Bacteroidota bacterium]
MDLLPYDGFAFYCGRVFDVPDSQRWLGRLLTGVEWKNDEVVMFGKRIVTKRKTAWHGDKDYLYTYSSIGRRALVWTDELRELKGWVEEASGFTYNSCLLNLYHDGAEGMSWHSDDEKELEPEGAIASVSFGAERRFQFKHKRTGEVVEVMLEAGSLLVMGGVCQEHWWHALPKTKKVREPRVNLTFRTIVG